MEQPFILPQPWTLNMDGLTPEQVSKATAYWIKMPGCDSHKFNSLKGYFSSEDSQGDFSYMYWGYGPPYVLITFEQFEEYVLNVPSQSSIVNDYSIY